MVKRRWKGRSREHRSRRLRSSLRFTPWAWAKFLFLCDAGETEVGGFGISSRTDPLPVEDVVLIPQCATPSFGAFDDEAVADHFDRQVDAGRTPEEFARIWLHTHPGSCPRPSPTDEKTFERVFGSCDWAVMGNLARGGAKYARLHFSAGPTGSLRIPVEVDYRLPFTTSDESGWQADFRRCVRTVPDLLWQGTASRVRHPRWLTPEFDLLPQYDWIFFPHEELTLDDRSLCEAGGPGSAGSTL
jgi:proteasome lid subunit RPN8/RPN11